MDAGEQAGIYAGEGGFDIAVGNNTDLKGAVIASKATPDKNKISTDTLTYSHIENQAHYEANNSGININTQSVPNNGIIKGITPNIGIAVQDSAKTITTSAISPGTIETRGEKDKDITDLSRDTEGALNSLGKIFDKESVQEKQELANLFGQEAFKAIGDIGSKFIQESIDKYEESNKKYQQAIIAKEEGRIQDYQDLMAEGNNLAQQAQNIQDKWGEGGENKILLHTLVGGITANLGGNSAASGAISAGINEAIQNQLAKLPGELREWGSYIIGEATGKLAGGQESGAIALQGTKYNSERDAYMNAMGAAAAGNNAVIKEAAEQGNPGGGQRNEEITKEFEKPQSPEQEQKKPDKNEEVSTDLKNEEMIEATRPQEEPEAINPAEVEGNAIKENGKYYRIENGEPVEINESEIEEGERFYVEGVGWYQKENGIDTYVASDREIDGKEWRIDEHRRDVYVRDTEYNYEGKSEEKQEILLKLENATSTAERIKYCAQYLGQDWSERIETYRNGLYQNALEAGMDASAAEMAADFATWELLTPVAAGLSATGGVIASDLGTLNKRLGNVLNGTSGSLTFKAGFEQHLINAEGVVRKGNKGIVGRHNLDNFKKVFTDNNWNIDDCIISSKEHSSIKGIYEIEYGIPALDKAGNIIPGQLKNIITPKTVYDPNIISDNQMIAWGKEAMANGTLNGRVITGQASNGLKFQGFIDESTGNITNFFPVLE